ncbi:hypothetical protein TYRP_015493 [Tyrophagus putrescentiae]|nr:hypothetical protein TYRP_015493 [Tyrophagus putrescentiae]
MAIDLKKVITSWSVDSYGGLHFDCTAAAAPMSMPKTNAPGFPRSASTTFERLVEQQIAQCRRPLSFAEEVDEVEEVRALWFRVSKAHVRLIAPLVKACIADCHLFCIGQRCLGLSVWLGNQKYRGPLGEYVTRLGFDFHHTKADVVVLVKPLSPTSNIPKYAFTNIGVGALVVDEPRQRVLVVKERRTRFKKMWKFPGGYVEQGEELNEAVEREVFEETGVRASFVTLLVLRHLAQGGIAFDCADMYFVAVLRPKDGDQNNTEISFCRQEIEQCEWAPLDTITEQMSPFNRFVIEQYHRWKRSPSSSSSQKGAPLVLRPQTFPPYFASLPPYTLYSIKYDEEEEEEKEKRGK